MKLLARWELHHHGTPKRIELYWGDLSWLPPEHAVDLLVVSAFPNDYLPTATSLVGALARNGVSIAQLALDKQLDMREDFSCWLSRPMSHVSRFRRVLCVESGWRGTPPEIADDIFRAIALSSLSEIPHQSIAMPLIGSGDQGYDRGEVMQSVLDAAIAWFQRGLDVQIIKIVAYSDQSASVAQKVFLEAKHKNESVIAEHRSGKINRTEDPGCDLFISYAHADSRAARMVYEAIAEIAPRARVFFDREILVPGASWLLSIAQSLDEADYVMPLYTPRYWASTFCKDEFAAAFIRQKDTSRQILFPVYYEAAQIPYLFRTIQFQDCREGDPAKLIAACRSLCARL